MKQPCFCSSNLYNAVDCALKQGANKGLYSTGWLYLVIL